METSNLKLFKALHVEYIQKLDEQKDQLEYWLTEHLRLNGIYWGLTALELLQSKDALDQNQVIDFVLSCYVAKEGGFGGFPQHDAHLLYTLSAIQILATYDALERLDHDKVVGFVSSLQQKDGSFMGDKWGEIDTRFSYCAISALSLLGRLDSINCQSAVEFILACRNFDGGFGTVPGAESHAAMVFCCVGALDILGHLDKIDQRKLGKWLSDRQVPEGGLNGRPEKAPDVCYSWWVLSSLAILRKLDWINQEKLIEFILKSQDDETGGIADRPGDIPDVFHTLFGIAGLSLMGFPGLDSVDPTYCMPASVIKRLNPKLKPNKT